METKEWLFNHRRDNQSDLARMSRKSVFPTYMNELEKLKIDKQLRKRDLLDEATLKQLEKKKAQLL